MLQHAPSPKTQRCNTERIAIRTVSQVGAGSEHIARALLPLAMAAKQKQKKTKRFDFGIFWTFIEKQPAGIAKDAPPS